MSKLTIKFNSQNSYDYFNIYISGTTFTKDTLPTLYATNITSLSYDVIDPPYDPIYVMVSSVQSGIEKFALVKKFSLKRDFEPEKNLSIQPMAFYKLNDLTGDYIDYSGNNRHATSNGTEIRGADSIDITYQKSAQLTPNLSTNMICSYNGSVSIGTASTIMMWCSIPDASTLVYGEFFKIGGTGTGYSIGFNNGTNSGGYSNTAGRFILIGQNAVSFRPTTLKLSNDAQNFHLAVMFVNGTLKIYLNGILAFTQSSVGNPNAFTDKWSIGMGENVISYPIKMSRVAIFNNEVPANDIYKCYANTAIQY